MTDRELLEMAAKAPGVSELADDQWEYYRRFWNPLTNDGDALRLEVILNMTTNLRFLEILAEENDSCDGNYIKARRRAISRYAAEIGKSMQ